MIIATIAASNYLPKVEVLLRSVRQHLPEATFHLCLIEKAIPPGVESLCGECDEVLLAASLPYEDFEHFVFRYSLLEASTAIKARLLRYLFDRYEADQIFFLDPDMEVFGAFTEALAALETHDILVTPHHLDDEETLEATADNVYRTLSCGIMNLGFLGLSRGKVATQFLDWWDKRLTTLCYVDFARGLFVDQRWIDLAFSFFDIGVLRHHGYNVANWNISKRPLERTESGITAKGMPLKLFHYSGLSLGKDLRIFRKYDTTGLAIALRSDYVQRLQKSRYSKWASSRWSYDCFTSGEHIASDTRLACQRNPRLLGMLDDPFSRSNEEFLAVGY